MYPENPVRESIYNYRIMNTSLYTESETLCCVSCNQALQADIWNETFYPYLLTLLAIVALLSGAVALARYAYRLRVARYRAVLDPAPLVTAALVLGIGVGGFIDGIVFHQLLQWHQMISAKLPPTTLTAKGVNMFWDGVFHLLMLAAVGAGIVLLWHLGHRRDVDKSGRLLAGGMLAGWGIFNIIEGVVDHQLMRLHNVREVTTSPALWNVGFLAASIVLLAVGLGLMRHRAYKPATVNGGGQPSDGNRLVQF
jgi:uncharacterized membrane protein